MKLNGQQYHGDEDGSDALKERQHMTQIDPAVTAALIEQLASTVEYWTMSEKFLARIEANFAEAQHGRLSQVDAGIVRGACRKERQSIEKAKPSIEELCGALRAALLQEGEA